MITFISRLVRRFGAFRKISLECDSARVEFHAGVEFHLSPGSKIVVQKGRLRAGYPLDSTSPYSTYSQTIISLGRNATLLIGDDTIIAPGSCIKLNEDAVLEIKGKSYFGHNLLVLCAKKMILGGNLRTSWNVTLIDHDGHGLISKSGKHFRGLYRPLVIGENVAIQMNVQVVRGVHIGDNAIISCGTVVRSDISAGTHVYSNPELKVRQRKSFARLPKLVSSRETSAQ